MLENAYTSTWRIHQEILFSKKFSIDYLLEIQGKGNKSK